MDYLDSAYKISVILGTIGGLYLVLSKGKRFFDAILSLTAIAPQLKQIASEFTANGGSSMKDKLTALEESQRDQTERLKKIEAIVKPAAAKVMMGA